MRVFVIGGTGAIGRPAIAALRAARHEVSALARSDSKAEWLRQQGAAAVRVSIFDRTALAVAFRDHDAVVNLATALPAPRDFRKQSAWTENIRLREQGSATVVEAALDAGVPRLLQESVSMIYRDGGSHWIDEGWPVDEFPAAQPNLAAEANARRFTREGATGIVLRFGWIYGPGAAHSEELLELARRWGICAAFGALETYVSSIHVIDAGRAVAAALTAPAGVYNVVDDEPLTKGEYADTLASAAGRKCYVRAPGRLSFLLGGHMTSLTRSLRVSNTSLKANTGWRPTFPSARDGWSLAAKKELS